MTTPNPTIARMVKEIYGYVAANNINGVLLSPHWRIQGDAMPVVVYELVGADWVFITQGRTEMATITMQFSCIAAELADALELADDVANLVSTRRTRNGVTFCAESVSYRASDAVPDDGSGDRERTMTVTTVLHVEDSN